MVGVQALSMSLVFVLSLRRGVGGVARIDRALIGLALIGVVGWQVSDEPLVAVICVVVADAAGVVMMLPKTWRDPGSETLSTFVLAAASGALATVAEAPATPALLIYPAYFAAINAATAAVIILRTRQLQRCLLYTSPSPRDGLLSRMPSSA